MTNSIDERPGQLRTRMHGNYQGLPTDVNVYTSNMGDVGFKYNEQWETTVIDINANRSVPEFFEMGYTMHGSIDQRYAHHYYVVSQLQKLGYQIVEHGEKQLFESKFRMQLEFLRHLKEHGKID